MVETGATFTEYIALQAPSSVATNFTWTLPGADGTANQCLATNGSGTLFWYTPAGGSANSLNASDGSPTNAVYVDAVGNVGVGTTSPSEKLEVSGGAILLSNDQPIAFGGTWNGIKWIQVNSGMSNYTLGHNRFYADTDASGIQNIEFYTNSPNTATTGAKMVISNNGNVGIGTTTPTRLLQVAGAMKLNPVTNPATPTAGDIYVDSAASNTLKYHNGSAWVSIGSGSGDFMSTGTVPMSAALHAFGGTVGAPGITFNGDTDNGIFAPAADNLAIGTSGAERMRILANGNVGIGTTAPTKNLHISGGNASGIRIQTPVGGSHGTVEFFNGPSNLVGSVTAENAAAGMGLTSMVGAVTISTNGYNERMRVDTAGNVGIGTTAPTANLEVIGLIKASGNIEAGYSTGAYGYFFTPYASNTTSSDEPQYPHFRANNTNWMDNSAATLQLQPSNAAGVTQKAYIAAISNTGAGAYTPTFAIGVRTGNTTHAERLRIDTAGNVGIGTTSPAAKLEVSGDMKLGNSAATCSASTEGSLRYNSSLKGMEFCNGTGWIAVGAGPTSCPTNFTLIGTAGQRGTFCIETSANAATTYFGSALACHGKVTSNGNHAFLCNDVMWYKACKNGFDATMPTTVHWISGNPFHNGTSYFAPIRGQAAGNCESYGGNGISGSIVYRCCIE